MWSTHGEQHRDDVAKVAVDDRSLDCRREIDRMELPAGVRKFGSNTGDLEAIAD